ncbi:uncharacterized protein J4E78_001183 [Alternaria triticimaculans]|uniref:uncharacterized protein n=1 Tax=Alternaria triticimaculans TaxID=297637 RepID=UPI0020C2A5EB|nr:uncharacterized protein J4E78_001183 [Alternaria triticimaculans]KAI4672681.1 hypothetical protein J4E78_001183 [Alternaria triticimaculans]
MAPLIQKAASALAMSHYAPQTTKAKSHIAPLVKIYVWRCPNESCSHANETIASEEGRIRAISSGNELREPMWYTRKCEKCSEEAGRGCCLLEVKLLPPEDEAKGKGKRKRKVPVDDDIEGKR